MKTNTAPGPVSFDCQQEPYGAFDSDTGILVLVVEASSEIEALARVDSVAPLLGVRGDCELLVVQMDQLPAGVPTFLQAFFEAGMIGFNRGNVAPGTSTLQ
ncbi:hypothetical protein [Rhodoferax ferrireducens]|uniref:hypothetical protein n=1 Tax=Rhodoferax ferrireducens TaxID=192843 RepID=UPI000E0DD683|nr:hypothetical protein [Rhodoferax ferrireducens]